MSDLDIDMIPVWNIPRTDAGFIYVIQDNSRLKIGKSTSPRTRIQQASTWLPEMVLIGVKPFWNTGNVEKWLHEGLAQWWFDKEWFKFDGDPYQASFIDNFRAFSDKESDRDENSINFLHWMNEFTESFAERSNRVQNLRQFQRAVSDTKKLD